MSLYSELSELGVEMNSHHSDLHIEDTPEVRSILEKYPLERRNSKPFKSALDGSLWIDVPFAFLPFWEAAENHR
jgi:hypothetical protein